jgi:hypothetical protein
MATQLSSITSANEMLEACDTFGASLAADPTTADLAPAWEELAKRAAELAQARHEMSRNAARLKGRAAVVDAFWDAEIDAFAAAALEASGNKLDQPPFSQLFARKGPAEAKSAGVELSVTILNRWLEELGRDEKGAFAAAWLPRLRGSGERLAAAAQGRKAADEARKAHEAQLAELRQKVGGAYDELEAALAQRLPDQPARAAAFSADLRLFRRAAERAKEKEEKGKAEASPEGEPQPPALVSDEAAPPKA